MVAFLRSLLRPLPIAAVFVAVGMFAVGFLPLFGGPGYEQSLASGLVVPSAAAIAVALELSASAVDPVLAVGRGIRLGLTLAAIAFATALAHGLVRGICDWLGGTLGFVLTAGIGAAMGGAWGACVAELARGRKRRRLWAVVGALAGPLGGVVLSVGRFYTSPIVFAFDPFAGYFSGTLYDTVIDPGAALLTYRAGSLATLAGLALVASVLTRDEAGKLRLVPLRADRYGADSAGAHALEQVGAARGRLALGILAWAVSLGVTVKGPALGHWQTSHTIAEDLGARRSGPRCDVVYPNGTREDDAALLLKDCEEELAAVEAALGARGPDRITAFFFRDAADKRRLMGAAETNIAKPWRHEVYVQMGPYPHGVLGHELAHVVAGSFGRGPFRIAGADGGLWPNPGLIEGVAVAASPDDDELTDAQWAHALLELKALPPIASVFSFDFLNAPAAKSYTIAGAFVRWVMDRWDAGLVRAWYGGASIEALTGMSWAALDDAFRAEVSKTPLSPEASAFAKARFEHAAIFGRKCPHEVDALRGKADHCRDALQVDKANELYGEVLARDPRDWAALYGRAITNVRFGDAGRGRVELEALAKGPDVPRTWHDRAADALADADLLAGEYDAAADRYHALAERSLDEDFARTAEVKAMVARDPRGRGAVKALLLGDSGRPPDLVLAAERLGEWADATGDVIALYLIGKNLVLRNWYTEGARYLDRALDTGRPPTARIGREMLRQRAVCACALGDRAAVKRLIEEVEDPRGPFADSEGRLDSIERLLARCTVH